MPDILGYWDRRADDPNYIGDDSLGRPIFKEPEPKPKKMTKKRIKELLGMKSVSSKDSYHRELIQAIEFLLEKHH